MRLQHLFDMDMEITDFSGQVDLVKPYGTEEGTGFTNMLTAVVTGERIKGTARVFNHPHRRSDGVMEPHVFGSLRTEDEALILFEHQGRTVFSSDGLGRMVQWIRFETEHERYRWLNNTICILEGVLSSRSLKQRIFACIHEMTEEA